MMMIKCDSLASTGVPYGTRAKFITNKRMYNDCYLPPHPHLQPQRQVVITMGKLKKPNHTGGDNIPLQAES